MIIDTGEHYERQSYRTRTRIVGPNGTADLVVPIVRRSGERMPMHTVGLSYAEHWAHQHVHAIRSAYGNTAWFIHFIDGIEAVLMKKYDRLVDLDMATLRMTMQWLGLSTEIFVSEEYVEVDESQLDLRNSLHPKRALPAGVDPVPMYAQVFADRHGFVPRMSVIDLVMNAGPAARGMLSARDEPTGTTAG